MDENNSQKWYTITNDNVLEALQTSKTGLTSAEAEERLQKYGKNALHQKPPKSIWKMIWEQLFNIMVLILLLAAVVSIVMYFVQRSQGVKEPEGIAEVIAIIVVIALNTVIGVVQERKAVSALEALKNMSAPTARVLRDGQESIIPASELVVGDIIYLEDGSIVPADVRILEASNLKIQEASLTGESVPVEKDANAVLDEKTPIAERHNMGYSSTIVMYGNATAVVTDTGMKTEVGKIATLLSNQDEFDTPIKKKLNQVGKVLVYIGLVVSVIILIVGLIRDIPWLTILMTAISLAVSVIPEGLPATSTIIMAIGVQRMAKKNALIKRLPAVESLGGATVICCDKTGTLTLNKMTVTELALYDNFKNADTAVVDDNFIAQGVQNLPLKSLLNSCVYCNNASQDIEDPEKILGDPTEGALIFLANKFDYNTAELKKVNKRLFEQPFDSVRKRMSVIHTVDGENNVYTKGAVDELLPLCKTILTENGEIPLTDALRKSILELSNTMSAKALRVLAFAEKSVENIPTESDADVENNLTFIGVVGMIDPPREEVIQAVETCHEAGIRVIMITGDHKITAMAIAEKLHIMQEGNTAYTGAELDAMTDEQLDEAVKDAVVFARVSPSDKLRIIQSLKRIGEIAGMTGDGVNDSPALKEADIGVAMGITGTDVAKDAADMILLDDNFTTVETAIREGRRIYNNIQKVIQFLVGGNIAEIILIFVAVCLYLKPMPIEPVHILLINLVTDALPAIALGMDPANADIMKKPPIKSKSLVGKDMYIRSALQGLVIGGASLAAYFIGRYVFNADSHVTMTMTFIVVAVGQLAHSLNQRSNELSLFSRKQEVNWYLYLAVGVSLAIACAVLFIPPLQSFFKLSNLTGLQWLVAGSLAVSPLVIGEIAKCFIRLFKKKKEIK